jgi:hypothetical protein
MRRAPDRSRRRRTTTARRTEAKLTYLKAVVVGVGIGLLAVVLWVLAQILPLYLESAGAGSGGIGAVAVSSGSALLVALVGFAMGFWWTVRRARRRPTTISREQGGA